MPQPSLVPPSIISVCELKSGLADGECYTLAVTGKLSLSLRLSTQLRRFDGCDYVGEAHPPLIGCF